MNPERIRKEERFNGKEIQKLQLETASIFQKVFESSGYLEHEPQTSLVSELDHSVRFIGSTTNVFKQYLNNPENIPEDGYFLVQKCLRTRNTNLLFDDGQIPNWSSYFTAMGTLGKASDLERLSFSSLEFIKNMGLNKERICLKVSSIDEDLLQLVRSISNQIGCSVEIDGNQNIEYYRHKYGMDSEGIYGRNFNLAVKNLNTNKYEDIGNIIVIEKDGTPIATEMGIGIGTFLSKKFSLRNSIESSLVSQVIPFEPGIRSKFADTVSVVVLMLKEGVQPGSRDKARLLRTNLVALKYFTDKLNISVDLLSKYIDDYSMLEFGNKYDFSQFVINYIKTLEHPNTNQIS